MKTVNNLSNIETLIRQKQKEQKQETEENKQLPMVGEKVRIEILEVDELEVNCWLPDYSMVGFIDNSSHTYDLRDVGRFYSFMQVSSTYEGVIWIKNPRIFVTDNGMGGQDMHKYIELL